MTSNIPYAIRKIPARYPTSSGYIIIKTPIIIANTPSNWGVESLFMFNMFCNRSYIKFMTIKEDFAIILFD
jgi:hypothetical protein